MNQVSTARRVLKIGWWINTVVYLLSLLIIFLALNIPDDIFTSDEKTMIIVIFIVLILIFLVHLLVFSWIKKVPESKGWSVAFLILGILSGWTLIGLLNLIGGLLGLSEYNTSQSQTFLKQQIQPEVTLENSLVEKLKELQKIKEVGFLTE